MKSFIIEKDLIVEKVLTAKRFASRRQQIGANEQGNPQALQEECDSILRTEGSPKEKLLRLTEVLQPFISFDYLEFDQRDQQGQRNYWVSFLRVGVSEYQTIGESELSNISSCSAKELDAMRSDRLGEVCLNFDDAGQFQASLYQCPRKQLYAKLFGLTANATLPMALGAGARFVVSFYSKDPHEYVQVSVEFLNRIQNVLAGFLRKLMHPVVKPAATQVKTPFVQPEQGAAGFFEGVVGESKPMLATFDLAKQVGPLDTSVMLLGETGTGKEILAELIHNLSARKKRPLVKINCAAIPAGLVESELFGHEKGAFTGAAYRRIGKFEQADGGTIFLDEIGDLPPDMQVKLLRVLQQQEIERIGGNETVKLNVRIISATNKVLETEIAEGRFRMDLYYRLNVFPICVPPLRKRKEDISLLVTHFTNLYAQKHHLDVCGITPDALDQLMNYDWPGNVRELENIVERSVILTGEGKIDKVFIMQPRLIQSNKHAGSEIKTIKEVEKDHIQTVLTRCNNKVYGPGGAAERLKIPPTTLMSKIKKLGIR